jgi:hypothetical protein
MQGLKGDSVILIGGYMLDFESLSSGKPVPPVDASDMKRLWELTSKEPKREVESSGGVAWDIRLISEQCSQGSDPLAVWLRVALLRALQGTGLLDNWCDSDRPREIVFQTLAKFPLPEGIQNFHPDELAETLNKAV